MALRMAMIYHKSKPMANKNRITGGWCLLVCRRYLAKLPTRKTPGPDLLLLPFGVAEAPVHLGRRPDHVFPMSAESFEIVELVQPHEKRVNAVGRRPPTFGALPVVDHRIAAAIDQMRACRQQSPLLVRILDSVTAGRAQLQPPRIVSH